MKRLKFLSMMALIAAMLVSAVGPVPGTVFANASNPSGSLIDRLNSMNNALTEEERQDIRDARNRVMSLTAADGEVLFKEIWDKVKAKKNAAPEVVDTSLLTSANVVNVFSVLGNVYFLDGNSLDEALNDITPTLDQLAKLAGVPEASEGISRTDIEAYFNVVESATKDLLSNKSLIQLYDLLENKAGLLDLAREANEVLLDESENSGKIIQVIKNLGITSSDIEASAQRILNAVDPDKKASKALMLGYIRTQSKLVADLDMPGKYVLKFEGMPNFPVTSDFFDWESSNPNYHVSVIDGKVVIAPQGTPASKSLTVTGKLNLPISNPFNGSVFVKQELDLGASSSLEPDQTSYQRGADVKVKYKLNGVNGVKMSSGEFRVQFDNAVFEYSGVEQTVPGTVSFNGMNLITYKVSDSAGEGISLTSGSTIFTLKLKVKSNAPTGTKEITAPAAAFTAGAKVYSIASSSVQLQIQAPADNGGGGGGGGGGGPAPEQQPSAGQPANLPQTAQEAADKATEKLDEIFQSGKPAVSETDKKAAQKAVENIVKEAAKIDVSNNVSVEGGVAKLAVSAEQALESFKQVKEIAQAANNALKAKDPEAEPIRVVATLEIGTIAEDKVEVNLPKDLVEAAKNEGIDAIAVSVNGLVMEIDVNQFSAGTVLSITKEDSAVADNVTSGTRVSDVYNFEFKDSEGQPLNNFDEPVRVSVPVNAEGVQDPNYLVFVKIDGGKVIPYGGKYNPETGVYEVERRSFSTYTVIENRVNFNDIESVESWAGEAIRIAAAKGIINGRAAGTFVPEGNITRAEFATLLVKTFGLEGNFTEKFNDVQDGDWYQPYIAAAAHYGIVNGRSATQFDPNAQITRSELAAMSANALIKIMKYKGVNSADAALAKFKDAGDIPAGLKAGVALLTQEGIISGMTPGTFEPNGNATRAQAAIIIYKLFQLK